MIPKPIGMLLTMFVLDLQYVWVLFTPKELTFRLNIRKLRVGFRSQFGIKSVIWWSLDVVKRVRDSNLGLTEFIFGLQVAKDPSGKEINALEQHIKNILSPSTPFFFNTLYDPYREGADFVRGYPFSLREGAPTAISHGLWLNIPDYDAPTQLVKPLERNTRYIYSFCIGD